MGLRSRATAGEQPHEGPGTPWIRAGDDCMAQCTALSKRSGTQCKRCATPGHRVCAMHGAKSPCGAASPHYRTGSYSRVLPVRLAQRYEEARINPALLSLRDDIAVCESRLMDLFQRVDNGESGQLWQTLGQVAESFSAAMTQGDVQAMHRHFARLRDLIGQGSADYAAWAEIQ